MIRTNATIDLLPGRGQWYKACLHTHTTVSDGDFTPEEIKCRYKEKGYSVVAFTDHEKLRHYPELADDSFLPLGGLEIALWSHRYAMGEPEPHDRVHLNLLATRPDVVAQPWFDAIQCARYTRRADGFLAGWEATPAEIVEAARREPHTGYHPDKGDRPDKSRYFDESTIHKLAREAQAAGFLVALNHPRWSNLELPDAHKFSGLWAVEVYNRDSEYSGPGEIDDFYDELLRGGRNLGLCCLATNDTHSDDAYMDCHIAHGWVNIRSERLDYESIVAALRAGHFYSSTGPEILEAKLTDGILSVKTSPCVSVRTIADETEEAVRSSPDHPGTEWELSLPESGTNGYVRLVAEDADGKKAWTNAVRAM